MHRTNIYLTDEQQRALTARARAEGISKAELVRRILDDALGLSVGTVDRIAAVKSSAGIWSDRSDTEIAELRRWRSVDRFDRLGL